MQFYPRAIKRDIRPIACGYSDVEFTCNRMVSNGRCKVADDVFGYGQGACCWCWWCWLLLLLLLPLLDVFALVIEPGCWILISLYLLALIGLPACSRRPYGMCFVRQCVVLCPASAVEYACRSCICCCSCIGAGPAFKTKIEIIDMTRINGILVVLQKSQTFFSFLIYQQSGEFLPCFGVI